MKELNSEQRGERQFLLRLLTQMEAMQAFAQNEYEAKHLAAHRAEIRSRVDKLEGNEPPGFTAGGRKANGRKAAV
jgi:hypothetical protein